MLPDEIADARQRRYNGTISWLRKPNPELLIMRVTPDFPVPPHRAGQYCSLGLGNWEPRFPGAQPEDLKPGDASKLPALTPRLFLLREGDRLNIGEKITGHYTLEPVKPGDTVVFLGTGTGEAPHNYMTWELLRTGHGGKVLHACCVRLRKDLGYLPIHQRL